MSDADVEDEDGVGAGVDAAVNRPREGDQGVREDGRLRSVEPPGLAEAFRREVGAGEPLRLAGVIGGEDREADRVRLQ